MAMDAYCGYATCSIALDIGPTREARETESKAEGRTGSPSGESEAKEADESSE
eukprot:m.94182 g.94182  ORF g.94182 m.94182 type:complete len:53 (+) comp36811_c0_seq18:981-1139(+)